MDISWLLEFLASFFPKILIPYASLMQDTVLVANFIYDHPKVGKLGEGSSRVKKPVDRALKRRE